jgi:carboxylesterase
MKDLSFRLDGSNGKGVLLIHGLTGVPAEMKWIGKALHKKGYTVYAPLLAGHGVDEATLLKTRWQDWRDSVLEAARRFGAQVDSQYSAGICVGGKLGMLAAQAQPGLLKAVALYSPCFRYDGWNVPAHYRWLSYLPLWTANIPWFKDLQFAETPSIGIKDARLREAMQRLSTEGVLDDFPVPALKEMLALSKAVKKQLPSMTTPTLIVHAREDDLSHPRHAHYIDTHLAAPHALHWMEDSYHMIHVDREHGKVADLTANYFEAAHG